MNVQIVSLQRARDEAPCTQGGGLGGAESEESVRNLFLDAICRPQAAGRKPQNFFLLTVKLCESAELGRRRVGPAEVSFFGR